MDILVHVCTSVIMCCRVNSQRSSQNWQFSTNVVKFLRRDLATFITVHCRVCPDHTKLWVVLKLFRSHLLMAMPEGVTYISEYGYYLTTSVHSKRWKSTQWTRPLEDSEGSRWILGVQIRGSLTTPRGCLALRRGGDWRRMGFGMGYERKKFWIFMIYKEITSPKDYKLIIN